MSKETTERLLRRVEQQLAVELGMTEPPMYLPCPPETARAVLGMLIEAGAFRYWLPATDRKRDLQERLVADGLIPEPGNASADDEQLEPQ